MAKMPEPTNLVLEQLRLMRTSIDALNVKADDGFNKLGNDASILRRQIIGEVYKANKTFGSYAES